jgi:hypothetical protein
VLGGSEDGVKGSTMVKLTLYPGAKVVIVLENVI